MGKRVLLTRTARDNDAWAMELQAAGLVPIEHPCIEREDLDPGESLVKNLQACTWLVLPSPEAVRRIANLGPVPASSRIACVGPASGQLAIEKLGRCELVAQRGTIAGLCAELVESMQQQDASCKVLIAGAEGGIDTSDELLREAGAAVQRVATYRTKPARLAPGQAPSDLGALGLDAILLGSPSALDGLLGTTNVRQLSIPIITLGPTTSAAARSAELGEPIEAKTRSVAGLIQALTGLFPPHNSEASQPPLGQRS
jgi:uroporphyrinogen-III synthase